MNSNRLKQVIDRIDAANREDPNSERSEDKEQPKELLYSQRMSAALSRFAPEASEPLRIAARAQHIRRWLIPRSDYPKTRPGYLKWRRDLGRFHAEETARIMAAVGYDQDSTDRVRDLLMKKGLKRNADVQTLEDVICLVFIEYYLEPFAAQHDTAKLNSIIRKTWDKMSPRGQQTALQLKLPQNLEVLLKKALSDETP